MILMLKVLPTTKHYNAGRKQRNGAQGRALLLT